MWNKITGKSDTTSSQDGRRKGQRRRTGSVTSSHASRNPTRLEDRSDYPPTLSSRSTTFPPPSSSASIASYTTAPDRRSTMDYDARSERTTAYDDREDDPRSTRTDKRRDDDSRTERSSKHRERSASRDRKRDRDDTERELKKKGKKDPKDVKDRRDKEDSSKKSTHKSRARTGSKASDTIVDEPVRSRAGDSLQRGDSYTSQTTYQPYRVPATGSAPTTPGHGGLDAHVGGQFPGGNPAQYTGAYRPPLGEATSYYGDQGESIQYQPGVRPEDPDMLINAHTHLITPSVVPKPPEETGHGSAVDFYSGTYDVEAGENAPAKPPRPESMLGSFDADDRPKPSRKTSKTEKMQKVSSAASAAGSAALGYARGKYSSHNQSASTHVTSSFEEHTENYTPHSGDNGRQYSTSYSMLPGEDYAPTTTTTISQSSKPGKGYASHTFGPGYSQSSSIPPSEDYIPAASQSSKPGYSQSYTMPPGGDYESAATQSNKPGKSSHSTAGFFAGAAGLAAGYGLHKHHSSHHDSPALPCTSQNGHQGSQAHGYTALGMQQKQTGPVSKFVDWWKDHEDVRKMEEYTEYIGVCRDCFDPCEPPSMAPRKHHYHHHHKRRSNGSLRSNRVDKESRYHYSSSEDDGRRKSNSWVAKGLAGYGLAKVGKALWWQNQDFDDTHSAKSGRRVRSSRSSAGRRSRSGSRDRTSITSRGVVRYRSNSRDSRAGRHYSRTIRDYKIVHHHDRSRSRSRDTKSGLFSAAAGAALGASLAGGSKERSRSRSKSPSREYVIKKSYVEKPRSSGSALGVENARRFSSRHSTTSSYVENKSQRGSNQGSTGVFGMFSGATSTNDRKKTHVKKKKGFFTFANSSSSSTDSGLVYGSPELRRRSSELRRKGASHKKRRNSDDKLNTTLLGLGATAAALAAVQGRRDEKAHSKGRPGPEVFAVRESKSRRHSDKQQHMPGAYEIYSSEDEEWEEVSDAEDDSASIDTGLAFGDYAQSIKSRKSVESLLPDASGTSKWDWRWGSKKDKRKRTSTESLNNGTNADGRGSLSSVPTLQTVFPVPTSDPTLFDAAHRSTSIPSTPQPLYGHPLETSRPEPVPLQQPQPIMPVSNSIYTSQAPGPSYMAPSGPPVFSGNRLPLATFENPYDHFRAEERPLGSPRRDEPSTPTSSWKRDAAIAGIAAATGAAIATAHSHASSKAGSSSPSQSTASRRVSSPSSVRFDLTKEQEEREDRQRRRDLRKKEEERAERERLRRVEDEASLKESAKRKEAERLAAIKRDAEEAEARAREKREQEGRAYAASEVERETRRIQREREAMALQAAEAQRVAREEAERLRQESEAATRQRERLEREILDADLRRERERPKAEELKSPEFEYDVESRERQLQQREANVVEPNKYSNWKEPVAAAGTAAGAAAAAAGLADRSKGDHEKAPRDGAARFGRVQFDDDQIHDEPVFDPDYFRKKDQARPSSRDRENDIVRKAASKVLADSFNGSSSKVFEDFEERYSEPRRKQSMAEFFSPSELLDRRTSISRDYFGPNADADVETSFNVPRIVTVEPPYAPEYSFTATHDPHEAQGYNDIPRLNLIEPTPPVSVASSIRGDRSHPTSPSMPTHQEPIKAVEEQIDPKDDKQPKRPGVTWGVDETRYFDTPTPDSVREHFMSDQDLSKNALEEWTRRKEQEQHEQHEQQLHDEIVVEHDSPGSSGKRTAYRVSLEDSYAEARIPPKPELDRKPMSGSSDDDSPVEEIKRFEDDGRPIIEATSPERTPVVLTPTEERRQFYQSPFFETVSDFTSAFDISPANSAPGFVEELGADEQPDVSDRGMPGAWGFQEEDVTSNSFSDTRRVVEELPSPTESPKGAKNPELQPRVEEIEDQAFEEPLSKRDQRKKDKAVKRSSLGRGDILSAASTPNEEPNPEELWEDASDSKSKKQKKKNLDSFGLDTESASASVASTPVAEDPAAEDLWEAPLSKKDKRKKDRELEGKRKERDREPTGMQPSTTTTSASRTPSASGLDNVTNAAKGLGYAAAAGVLADVITSSRHKDKYPEEPRGREQEPRQPPYPTGDTYVAFTQTPGTYGGEGEHTPSGTFTSTAPYIPSRAFDDIEELADAKKPSNRGRRRSKYGSPSPGSPLRTEVAFDDYVGMDAAAATTAAITSGSGAGAYQTLDFAAAVNAPLPNDDASVSSRESEKDARRKRQYVFDEHEEAGVPLAAWQEEEEDKFERTSTFFDKDERRKHRRSGRQESEGGSRERDARSTTSDERAFDEEGRRKHRHHRRRESEHSDSTRDPDTRSVVSEGRYDDEGHRKHKHRKHRFSGVDKADPGAIAAEFRDDEEDDRRRHKHKKRVEIEPTIPERPRSDPGVDVDRDGEERRKHKRRSKREGERDDDTASVASGPAKYSEKEKEKRSSLFSSLFGRSSKESVVSRESKDDRSIDDDEERRHRRRKHRSATLPSYASDDDGVSTVSRRGNNRREKTARDDSGMDYSSRKHEHDKVFDYNPSRVSTSPFSANENQSMSPVFPGSFPTKGGCRIPDTEDFRPSSLSYIDDAASYILSTCKQVYTTTEPADTAAAPSTADDPLRDPVVAASSQSESFLTRRARGPEATAPASASLTSPPLPTLSTETLASLEKHSQQPPSTSANSHHQRVPSTAASLLTLGNGNDPEFDEVFPISTALPPSRPESPTDTDEETAAVGSPPPSLGINTRTLKQQGEAIGSPTGLRSPSSTAIPLRFRISTARSVSGSGSTSASGVQSPVTFPEQHPLSHSGAPSAMMGSWGDDHQEQHQQQHFGGVSPPLSPSSLQEEQRYYAQQASSLQQDVAASQTTTNKTPIQSRHAAASPMPSPTAIPNPFFRPRPLSMYSMHKKTPSAGVITTGKELRPLYLVESVRGRSKSSPVGIRGKERWSEEAWAERHGGEMGDEIAVEDLPALPGSRNDSEASVQSARSADDALEGGDEGAAVEPEMTETTRKLPETTTTDIPSTSMNVFDFLVQDDEDDGPARIAKETSIPASQSAAPTKASSSEHSSKASSGKTASPSSSSLLGGLLSRSSSKKGKKGKKAKKLGTVSPPRSSSPKRKPDLDLAWRERDTADAVAGWFEGNENSSVKPAGDVAVSSSDPGDTIEDVESRKKEEAVPKEVQVPPAPLARDGKGKGKAKAKSKSSKAKAKRSKGKGKSEASTDVEAGDNSPSETPSETPTQAHLEAEEHPHPMRPQGSFSRDSGFDRDVDRDLCREELGHEEPHRGHEASPTRLPQVPLRSNDDVDVQQMEASRDLGSFHDETVELRDGRELGPTQDESSAHCSAKTQPEYPLPPEIAAYLVTEDHDDRPSTVSAPGPASGRAPDVVEPDLVRSAGHQHDFPKVRLERDDDAASIGPSIAGATAATAATAALVASQEQDDGQQESAASPKAEELITDKPPPPTAEPSAPADEDSDDLNPVLAPAKVSKKDKRKAKKKKKALGRDSEAKTPRATSPAPVSEAQKGQEQKTSESLLKSSEPALALGEENLPRTTSREESKETGSVAASPAFRDDGKVEGTQLETSGASGSLDDAPLQTVKPAMHEQLEPSLGRMQEERPITSGVVGAVPSLNDASEPHHTTEVQGQPPPEVEVERGIPRHEVKSVNENEDQETTGSVLVDQQHKPVAEATSSIPLPVSPPSLPITSAVMESIFSATEQARHPRDLSELHEREELGRDNVANMPLPEIGEDEMEVGTEKPMTEKSTSAKPQMIPIPSTYLPEPLVQEPSSIGQSPPSSVSVDTPPANAAALPTALGKKGKKRSSSVAAVTAVPSAPLFTLATPPPVQKARKCAEPKAKEEFVPSLEDVAGPTPTSEPVIARSLPLPGEHEQGATSKPEPIATRSLHLPGHDEEGATSMPKPEMLESGINTPPIHDVVFEMGQAVQVEVTSPTEKPTSVEVGQAVPVPVRVERPVPVESQRGDGKMVARDAVAGAAGLETDVDKEEKTRDQDVVAAKEQLEALGVGAPLEVVMEDLAEANVEKKQEFEQGETDAGNSTDIDDKEPPLISTGQPVEPKEAGEDEWAMSSSKKKGKKGKGKKEKLTSTPGTPQELDPEISTRTPGIQPTKESTAVPSIEQLREQPVIEATKENDSGLIAAAPEEAGEDEWAVLATKESKKGKKSKRESMPNSPPLHPHVESSAPLYEPSLHDLTGKSSESREIEPSNEKPLEQPTAKQEGEFAIPSAAPTDATGEDEWAMPSGKKKSEKGKKGNRLSVPGSPAPEPVTTEREPETFEPLQGSVAEEPSTSQPTADPVSRDIPAKPTLEDVDVFAGGGAEAREDEWAVPVRKKSNRGEKGKSVEISDSTPVESGTTVEPESRIDYVPLDEPAIESESFRAAKEPPVESQSVETDAGEPGPTNISAAQEFSGTEQVTMSQPEEAGEDERALSSDKRKGKKGKKGKQTSLPISPLASSQPESLFKPDPPSFETIQDPDMQMQETATRDQVSKKPSYQIASDHVVAPAEAGEDEWTMPSRNKKGKKGKRLSLPSSAAPDAEPGVESLSAKASRESKPEGARSDVNVGPFVAGSAIGAGIGTIESAAPAGMEAAGDEWSVPVKKKGKKGKRSSLSLTTTEATHKPQTSEITAQPLDEQAPLQESPEVASPAQEASGWASPPKESKVEDLSLLRTSPILEDAEKDVNEEYFIDPAHVLKYTVSAVSAQNEPHLAETKTGQDPPQEHHHEPMVSGVEPETRPSSPGEEFVDPSDALKHATAAEAGPIPDLDEQHAPKSDIPRPASVTERYASHQRSTSPLPEPVVERLSSTAESSTPADDSDLNPVLAPAKVSKKDKKKAKKKNKLQASLADYATLDSSQNATDTEPLLASESAAERSNETSTEPAIEPKASQSQAQPVFKATGQDQWAIPAKKSKNEKRKAKKSKGNASPPMAPQEGDLMAGVEYFSPTEETGRGLHDESSRLVPVQDAPSDVPEKAADVDDVDDVDASKSGAPAPKQTPESDARQYAEPAQSDPSLAKPLVETTPVHKDLPTTETEQDQSISGQQHLETDFRGPEERAKTPSRDVDFAATVAAGLKGAGLDANLVLNDPSFAERPPRSVGEADPEEVSVPARPRKKKSAGAASLPIEQDKRSSLPEDKLPGQDATFDAALSSVLADPTFDRRTPSPDSAKEAVSDEFFPFQKRPKKKKGKKSAPQEDLLATREHLENSGAPLDEQSSIPIDTNRNSAPISDPSTPFEEHMTEYFPVGAAHPAAIHVPPPPPLPNFGDDGQLEKVASEGPESEGLGLMGMRGSSSKSWAEQMEDEEENMVSSLEKGKGRIGGQEAAVVGAAVVGAAGMAVWKHQGEQEMKEVGKRGREPGPDVRSMNDAPKTAEKSPILPEERPVSPTTQSKVSQLFPGLERVKRRTPSRRNFEQGVPERRPSPIKQEHNAVRLTQPIPSNWATLTRDSAVTMNDMPTMGVDPFHDAGRDSGYHDDSRRESTHVAGHFLEPVPEVEAHQLDATSNAQENVAASPTASITTIKQRSSALFQSSPGSTETPVEPPLPAETAGIFSRQVTEPITIPPETTEPYVSIFGDGVPRAADKPPPNLTPPRMWSPQPLDTIREHSPEESPLAKKGRPLSDVGMPEHGLKSMRRSDTDDMEVSPRALSEHQGTPKKIWSGKQPDKETGRARGASIGSDVAVLGGQRPSSAQSDWSSASKGDFGSIFARIKTLDMLSPAGSALSQRSATTPLRRINRAMSGDLRTACLLAEAKTSTRQNAQAAAPSATTTTAGPSTYDRVHDKGKARALTMNEEYEGWGDAPDTPLSPSRPPSIRKRQSMHIMDLETRLDQLVSENRLLQDAKARAEEHQRDSTDRQITEAVQARDEELRAKDAEIASINQTLASLREEFARLTAINASLTAANKNLSEDTNQRYATLQAETQQAQEQYEQTTADLNLLQQQYRHLQAGVEDAVCDEVNHRLKEKESEIAQLHDELADAREQIKTLQQQILGSKQGETFLEFRDEDYFDQACQQLCQHVQQWVLRFSKFSDTRACRLSSEVRDEKIEIRLDNAILDGTDVDMLLADRVRRRDVFMSVVMTMIWEYVFTRYLFGMDREQRQKLKALEKQLSEVGPQRAVAQWRAITLTLLSRRENFQYQRSQDAEAVVQEIYNTLSALLPPPSNLVDKVLDSLRNVMRLAVDLSIEMRTQRAEYIMLPPLQPEYDKHGDLLRKVHFNASLMNERSGETTSNADLEAAHTVVKIVLFPLVVKKGDDLGDGEDEIVVCPAQVLTAKQTRDRKVVRVLSDAMAIDDRRSAGNASHASALPGDEGERSVVDLEGGF